MSVLELGSHRRFISFALAVFTAANELENIIRAASHTAADAADVFVGATRSLADIAHSFFSDLR